MMIRETGGDWMMRSWGRVLVMVLLGLAVAMPALAVTTSSTTVVHHAKAKAGHVHSAAAVKSKVAVKAAPAKKTSAKAAVGNTDVKVTHKKGTVKKPVAEEASVKKTPKAVPVEKIKVKTARHRGVAAGVAGAGAAAAIGDQAAIQATAQAAKEDALDDARGGPSVPLVKDGDPQVGDIKVVQQGRKTQVWLALTNTVNYRWFTLPDPARLVVDFTPEVKFNADTGGVNYPAGSAVQALRAGRFRPGTVRMVMDLKQPQKLSVQQVAAQGGNGPRLLIAMVTPRGSDQATNVPPPSDVVTAVPTNTGDAAAAADEVAAPTQAAAMPTGNGAPVVIGPTKKNGRVVKPSEQAAAEDQPTAAPTLPVRPVPNKSGSHAPVIVVLDPGHGGVDPGTHGRSYGTLEKNLTLSMARRVREDLLASWGDNQPSLKIIMTRDSDVYIPLPERVKIAQRASADLFVSLHADSAPDSGVTGATVYMVSSRGSDKEARRLAAQENSGDATAGIPLENESKEVQDILISLVQRDTMNNSTYLGQNILKNVGNTTAVRKRSLMYAGFRVLEAADVPSVLVEMGYLSNPREEQQLVSPEHQKDLAHAIAQGVKSYIQQYVHH